MEKSLKTVTKLITDKYDIEEEEGRGVMYRIVDKKTGDEKAQIQLSIDDEATVADYSTNNHWFTPSDTKTERAICVKWISSNEKGLGSLMLAYGVLKMKQKHSKIKYSVLDDDSDQSTHITKNIYSRFGYSPTEHVVRTSPDANTVRLKGPEKQVLLTDFVKNVNKIFEGTSPTRTRSRSRAASHRSRSRDASHRSRSRSRSRNKN